MPVVEHWLEWEIAQLHIGLMVKTKLFLLWALKDGYKQKLYLATLQIYNDISILKMAIINNILLVIKFCSHLI